MEAICLQDKEECTPKPGGDKLGEENECGASVVAQGAERDPQPGLPGQGTLMGTGDPSQASQRGIYPFTANKRTLRASCLSHTSVDLFLPFLMVRGLQPVLLWAHVRHDSALTQLWVCSVVAPVNHKNAIFVSLGFKEVTALL